MENLTAQLAQLVDEFKALEGTLADPEAPQRGDYIALSQRYAQLRDAVSLHDRLMETERRISDARAMLDESDPEMQELAQAELAEAESRLEALQDEALRALVPPDPTDARNAIIEIRAGAGGEESALFAGELARMYQKYAENQGWRSEFLDASHSELGGFKEISFMVQGRGAFGKFKFESGVHRVQRVPKTESGGRVHTSTATVAVLPEVEEVEIEIKPEDIRVDVFRAGGPGGQSVNTTDSAVRITHTPTGITVSCQDQKSQHKNKARAMTVLRSRLKQKHEEEQHAELDQQRRIQIGTAARSEKIRTYNFPQNRITDHRIELTLHRLEPVLKEGQLALLIEPLEAAYLEDRIGELGS